MQPLRLRAGGAGQPKLVAQLRLIGGVCPILNCAVERKVEYCLRDCDKFPCPHFKGGPYPFSEGYLQMQARRRDLSPTRPVAGRNKHE